MSGWLIATPYDADAGLATLEALYAVWHPDRATALELAKGYSPRGSGVQPRVVSELSRSTLRGLRLRPGEAGLLHADQPWI